MKHKLSKSILRYTAVFEPADEGGFVVTVPKLPGLTTEGDTFEEALRLAQDEINGYLEVLQDAGEPISDPL